MRALTSAPPPGAPACAVLAGSLRPPERAASILYDRPAMLDVVLFLFALIWNRGRANVRKEKNLKK